VKLSGNGHRYRDVANLGGLGFTMVVCVALGVGAGLWLDKRFARSPDFTIAGLFVGVLAAFYEVLRAIKNSRQDDP
jgi:F0F1-type ATP synthase assembly protein I